MTSIYSMPHVSVFSSLQRSKAHGMSPSMHKCNEVLADGMAKDKLVHIEVIGHCRIHHAQHAYSLVQVAAC